MMEPERARNAGNDQTSGEVRRFKASWPSLAARIGHYKLAAIDVFFMAYIVSMIRSYGMGGAIYSFKAWLWVVPVCCRAWHRMIHFLLSVPVLPSPLLYYKGGLANYFPQMIAREQKERVAMCSHYATRLLQIPSATPVSITTPDGAELSGCYFLGNDRGNGTGKSSGPSIIRFNGNGEAWELMDPSAVRGYVEQGVNVLIFNYRGVHNSAWPRVLGRAWLGELVGRYLTMERDAAIRDADSVMQFVVNGLGVPRDRLLLLGHSIGAAFSIQAALGGWQDVCVCNSRSFSSLSATVQNHAGDFLGLSRTSPWLPHLRSIARWLVTLSNWELDSGSAWGKMRGFKWVEYAREDHIIPPNVSLYAVVGGSDFSRELQLTSLRGDNHNRSLTPGEWNQHLALVETALGLTYIPASTNPADPAPDSAAQGRA